MANDTNEARPDEPSTVIDAAQMWENLCLADELSADCLALADGLAAQVGNAGAPPPPKR